MFKRMCFGRTKNIKKYVFSEFTSLNFISDQVKFTPIREIGRGHETREPTIDAACCYLMHTSAK